MVLAPVLAGFSHTGVTRCMFVLVTSCKVTLSGFIIRFLDCQELEPEPDSEVARYLSGTGYNWISGTSLVVMKHSLLPQPLSASSCYVTPRICQSVT